MTSERGLLLTPSGPDVARFGVGFLPLELEELACEFTEEEFPSARRGGDHCFHLLLLLDLAGQGEAKEKSFYSVDERRGKASEYLKKNSTRTKKRRTAEHVSPNLE